VTRGVISAGIQTGFCRDTGGALSESFIAHESQVFRVPEGVSDQAAVLVEPFACALHGALQVTLTKQDTALVIGCGAIGLLTIAALRLSGCEARIVAVAKHDHQRVLAKSLGATVLLDSRPSVAERYALWAKELGAEVLRPELGKPAVMGGATAVFDCVASSQSIDDGIRFTESGGTYLLVGMPGIPRGVDFTPLWFQELTVRSAYAYGPQDHPDGQRDTFELALDMMAEHGSKLAGLVGEPFALTDYREALGDALSTGRSGAVKTVIAPNG
jgi:threonine dehydrogenase-like Zn-dependent dehydrogenase